MEQLIQHTKEYSKPGEGVPHAIFFWLPLNRICPLFLFPARRGDREYKATQSHHPHRLSIIFSEWEHLKANSPPARLTP
ncbi:hypothetical protein [Prosthecobacter sp.]|uniref:hypothetical protein n=1 Tax=Prosthecobacter sp. TaxID=1965333 RepID=UPI00378513AA